MDKSLQSINCLIAAASTAVAGHTTMPARAVPQWHLVNRHAMQVLASDSYAVLFMFDSQYTGVTWSLQYDNMAEWNLMQKWDGRESILMQDEAIH